MEARVSVGIRYLIRVWGKTREWEEVFHVLTSPAGPSTSHIKHVIEAVSMSNWMQCLLFFLSLQDAGLGNASWACLEERWQNALTSACEIHDKTARWISLFLYSFAYLSIFFCLFSWAQIVIESFTDLIVYCFKCHSSYGKPRKTSTQYKQESHRHSVRTVHVYVFVILMSILSCALCSGSLRAACFIVPVLKVLVNIWVCVLL